MSEAHARIQPKSREGDFDVLHIRFIDDDGNEIQFPPEIETPEEENWHNLTDLGLLNGWALLDAANFPARYRKRLGGVVEMEGMLDPSTDGADIFTLPAGYRPTQKLFFVCAAQDKSYAIMTVDTDGKVQCGGIGPSHSSPFNDIVWVSLANIRFST